MKRNLLDTLLEWLIDNVGKFIVAFWILALLTLVGLASYFTGSIGRTIKVGEISIPSYDVDPFLECTTNVVLEVRGSWVRYVNQHSYVHDSKLNDFRSMYKKVGMTPEKP